MEWKRIYILYMFYYAFSALACGLIFFAVTLDDFVFPGNQYLNLIFSLILLVLSLLVCCWYNWAQNEATPRHRTKSEDTIVHIVKALTGFLAITCILFSLIYMFVDDCIDPMLYIKSSSITTPWSEFLAGKSTFLNCAFYWASALFLWAVFVFVGNSYNLSNEASGRFKILNSQLPHWLFCIFVPLGFSIFCVELYIRADAVCTVLGNRPDVHMKMLFCHSKEVTVVNSSCPSTDLNDKVPLIGIFYRFLRPLILLLYAELVFVIFGAIIVAKFISPHNVTISYRRVSSTADESANSLDRICHACRRCVEYTFGVVLILIVSIGPVGRLYFRIMKEKDFSKHDVLLFIEPYSRLIAYIILNVHIVYFHWWVVLPAKTYAQPNRRHRFAHCTSELVTLLISSFVLAVYVVLSGVLSAFSISYYDTATDELYKKEHEAEFILKIAVNFFGLFLLVSSSLLEIFLILMPMYTFDETQLKKCGWFGAGFAVSGLIFHVSEVTGLYFAGAFMEEVITKFASQNVTVPPHYTTMIELTLGITATSPFVNTFDFTCALMFYMILTAFMCAGVNPFLWVRRRPATEEEPHAVEEEESSRERAESLSARNSPRSTSLSATDEWDDPQADISE